MYGYLHVVIVWRMDLFDWLYFKLQQCKNVLSSKCSIHIFRDGCILKKVRKNIPGMIYLCDEIM